jgi:hypothetical protein
MVADSSPESASHRAPYKARVDLVVLLNRRPIPKTTRNATPNGGKLSKAKELFAWLHVR